MAGSLTAATVTAAAARARLPPPWPGGDSITQLNLKGRPGYAQPGFTESHHRDGMKGPGTGPGLRVSRTVMATVRLGEAYLARRPRPRQNCGQPVNSVTEGGPCQWLRVTGSWWRAEGRSELGNRRQAQCCDPLRSGCRGQAAGGRRAPGGYEMAVDDQ